MNAREVTILPCWEHPGKFNIFFVNAGGESGGWLRIASPDNDRWCGLADEAEEQAKKLRSESSIKLNLTPDWLRRKSALEEENANNGGTVEAGVPELPPLSFPVWMATRSTISHADYDVVKYWWKKYESEHLNPMPKTNGFTAEEWTPEMKRGKMQGREVEIPNEQVEHMVRRFLTWRLPENFTPDAGISFKPTFNDHLPEPMKHHPVGTNLFDYVQAKAMVLHMLEGTPSAPAAIEQARPQPPTFKCQFCPFGGQCAICKKKSAAAEPAPTPSRVELLAIISNLCFDLAVEHLAKDGIELFGPRIKEHADAIEAGVMECGKSWAKSKAEAEQARPQTPTRESHSGYVTMFEMQNFEQSTLHEGSVYDPVPFARHYESAAAEPAVQKPTPPTDKSKPCQKFEEGQSVGYGSVNYACQRCGYPESAHRTGEVK